MRTVHKIEAVNTKYPPRKRVAAYARVSGGKEAMLDSLSAQISYYNSYIQKRADWEFAGVYADEAKTGTKDSRPEFQRLLQDCRAGKIDMVVTKSISRFARNTLTTLESVRELKALGINVYFERENIHTDSGDGELLLTLLASYAQEESRSASENNKWRIQKMFQEGRTGLGKMLGYRLVDGVLAIVPEEAEIVRMIFTDYLSGMGKNALMRKLNGLGVPSPRGKKWSAIAVTRALRNEKYAGDLLLQKYYITDHLTKTARRNQGERQMYLVRDSHEAIIDRDTFNRVQREIERRSRQFSAKKPVASRYAFSERIRCGICGKRYRRHIAHSDNKYRRTVWLCSTATTNGISTCPSRQIPESILMMKTAEVLGIEAFDEAVFTETVAEILIPCHGQLTFIFKDGAEKTVEWQYPPRGDKWTEDMRKAAGQRLAERQRRRYEK